MTLDGQTAVVTGGTKGVGRGVALELARAGARVFVTGRSVDASAPADQSITAIRCDHRDDAQVDSAFDRVLHEAGAIDILVNNVWGGYDNMIENGQFTWPKPFWEQPLWRWDEMFHGGVRAHYRCSQLAAPSMTTRRRGLIVNISHWAAQKHIGNTAYGVSKAATDKLTADMAFELKPFGVTVVSLYPGMVRTEKVMEAGAVARLEQLRIAGIRRAGGGGAGRRSGRDASQRRGPRSSGSRQGLRLHGRGRQESAPSDHR
jgi:NAD(P)-dependent dehydrogenase (short-subunit alcohol dehydrogenase family)